MHEVAVVVSDLYLAQEAPEQALPAGMALPGLHHVTRFGARTTVVGGWRAWLARWLAGRDSGGSAAAPVAATVVVDAVAAPMVWMATPVHLVAGLTSVHLDRRSILRLGADDRLALAADFQRVFDDSGFRLQPLASGDFLLFGPQLSLAEAPEPARAVVSGIADSQRAAAVDPMLRRLGAEMEMWLHEHPVNTARARRGEAPVSGLWMWGGGPAPAARVTGAQGLTMSRSARSATDTAPSAHADSAGDADADIAFGDDAYLQGLWASAGQRVFPLPAQLADVLSYSHARRAALVIDIGSMLHANPTWTVFDAVAQIDRDFIAPAIEALQATALERLVIVANDHQLSLRARDRFKIWRRTPPGLSGLQ